MAKSTSNPQNIKPKLKGQATRSTSYVSFKTPTKRIDRSLILKSKQPGTSLGDYSLDLMKLG